MRLFAIRDLKAQVFTHVITDRNSAQAERNFKTAVSNPESDYARYPQDFQLFELGSYDPDQGVIKPHSQPILICSAESLKAAQ